MIPLDDSKEAFVTERIVNATMTDAIAWEARKRKPLPVRIMRNVLRFPRRTAESLSRLWNPVYRLERRARRDMAHRLSVSRRQELKTLKGTSSVKECSLLAYLAKQAPAGGAIVEIGTWKGKTAAWLVEGSQLRPDPLPLVTIDPHEFGSWPDFQAAVAQLRLDVRGLTALRAGSAIVGKSWTQPISLLWIDGSHDYADVRADIENFVPHVVPGGYVVFDDASEGLFPGVERAIAELMIGRAGFRHLGVVRHLDLFVRNAEAATKAA